MPADFDISPVIEPPVASQPSSPPPQPSSGPSGPSVTPAQPTMPRRNPHRMLKWLVLVAAGLFVISVGSLWWGGNSFSDRGVKLEIEASTDQAVSGDEITYTIKYRNDTKVSLSDLRFRLFWPEDSIVLVDGEPQRPDSEGFEVDELQPGQEGEREVKAFLVGDKGSIKTARLNLIFKAGNFQSDFEKEVAATTTITDLPVSLTLVAPPTVVSGQTVSYILDVRNDSGNDLSDMKLRFTYPDGFTVQEFQPQPSQGNTVWDISSLSDGSGKRYQVTGALSGSERETKTVTAVLQRNLNGQYVDYVRTEAFTVISSPLLSVSVAPEGGRDYVSFAGDTLRYVVTFRNNSRFSFLGLLLGIRLEGEMYDLSGLEVRDGFFDEGSGTVVFDASGISQLSQLGPGQSGTATFSVPLRAGFPGAGGTSSFFVKATARLSTTNVPSGLDQGDVSALDSVITKISAQPSLAQAVLYHNSAGSGPLPPEVGEVTTLGIRWRLINPGNDVRDAVVTATLPTGITWVGPLATQGGSEPTFDANTKRVTWRVGTLPFGTGSGAPAYETVFQVSFQPSSNQINDHVLLISNTAFVGTDAFTNTPVEIRLQSASTSSIEGYLNQGRVQP